MVVIHEEGGDFPPYVPAAVSDLTFPWAHLTPHCLHTGKALEPQGVGTVPFVAVSTQALLFNLAQSPGTKPLAHLKLRFKRHSTFKHYPLA